MSIAEAVNEFFKNFDFVSLAQTLNVWVGGIITTIRTALQNIEWSKIWDGIIGFVTELDINYRGGDCWRICFKICRKLFD